MKKIVLAIAVIICVVISITYYLNTNTPEIAGNPANTNSVMIFNTTEGVTGNADSIRITYAFTDDRVRSNYVVTSCLDATDGQKRKWQNTELQTCGSENQPCVFEGPMNRESKASRACEFIIMAPSGLNGNPLPSFETSQGWESESTLVLVDDSQKTMESFVSPLTMKIQFLRNGKLVGSTNVSTIAHENWIANYLVKWKKS